MERQDFYQAQTDALMSSNRVNICGNEYTATALHIVRSLFASPSQSNPDPRPLFIAINCISNTPNRQYREILINAVENGGGATDFSTQIAGWRNIIDAVQAPPPKITDARLGANAFRFTIPAQRGRTNRVECTTDFRDWTTITNVFGTNAPVVVRDTNVFLDLHRFYRVVRQ
jgi:hypothetical protein